MPYTDGITTQFQVSGIPSPGGSKKSMPVYRWIGGKRYFTTKVVLRDMGGENTVRWREEVAAAARQVFDKPLECPVRLEVEFIMMRPKSHYRSNGVVKEDAPYWHTSAPDTTKLLRSTEDALKGIAWVDDCQVVQQSAQKHYGADPGARITIKRLSSIILPE